jgi:hypothetical protein
MSDQRGMASARAHASSPDLEALEDGLPMVLFPDNYAPLWGCMACRHRMTLLTARTVGGCQGQRAW